MMNPSITEIVATVFFALHGVFMLFLGLVTATREYQDPLKLREGLLVGFFLAGLVALGSTQAYWLKPVLERLNGSTLFFGATALTAVTDNAALTYLGSLVEGLSAELKYALVAGAVTGGWPDGHRKRTESCRNRHPAVGEVIRERRHQSAVAAGSGATSDRHGDRVLLVGGMKLLLWTLRLSFAAGAESEAPSATCPWRKSHGYIDIIVRPGSRCSNSI
jgi:hypothetical protein